MRWLENNHELLNPNQSKRLRNFDTDLNDCTFFSALVEAYIGKNIKKFLLEIKPFKNSEQEL